MSNIKAKNRNPNGLGYNSWSAIPLGVDVPSPLGLNSKFTHLTYTLTGALTVGLANIVNVVSGNIATNPAVNTSYGFADFAGTFVPGETITLTIGTEVPFSYNQLLPFVYTVTSRDLTLEQLVADFVSFLNYNDRFNGTDVVPFAPSEFFGGAYIANSLGSEMVFQPLSYTIVTTPYTITTNSHLGTVTAGGADMVAGTGGPNPVTVPILDQTDGNPPMVPSATAIAGNGLFPVDIILPTFNASQALLTGSVYAYRNHDAIFPANSAITLTNSSSSAVPDAFVAVLYGTPVDNHPQMPAESAHHFKFDQFTL